MNKKYKLLYDGECPICEMYSNYMMPKLTSEVEILDARNQEILVKQLLEKNYNINDGMIFISDTDIYQGDDAIYQMSKLFGKKNLFDKFINLFMNNKLILKFIYPPIKLFRLLLLKILNIDPKINKE